MQTERSKKSRTWLKLPRLHHLRHPFMVPVAVFLVLFFVSIALFIGYSGQTLGASDSRLVVLTIDGKQQIIPTTAPTVGALLKRLNIKLDSGDIVEPSTNVSILQNNFQINIYHVHPVTVIESDQKTVIQTASNDPRAIAQQAGYKIYPQDNVSDDTNASTLNQNVLGQEITIVPATPIMLNLYGNQVTVRTQAKTVGELLSDEKIKTTSGNNVIPALSTPITPNMGVLVVPVGQQLTSAQQTIAYSVQTVSDPSIPYGTTAVQQAGVNGLALVVEDTTVKNGVSTTTPLQQVVVTPPIPEIVENGTGIVATAGGSNVDWLKSSDINSGNYQYVDFIMNHESHWDPSDVNSSGCIGLGQSCNPYSLETACPDWQSDAVCQLNFFNNYVVSHGYGTWYSAYIFWVNHGYW